jgi:hypothetical protein
MSLCESFLSVTNITWQTCRYIDLLCTFCTLHVLTCLYECRKLIKLVCTLLILCPCVCIYTSVQWRRLHDFIPFTCHNTVLGLRRGRRVRQGSSHSSVGYFCRWTSPSAHNCEFDSFCAIVVSSHFFFNEVGCPNRELEEDMTLWTAFELQH